MICLALAAALVLPASTATATPQPSASEARRKLQKLNEQVDQLVEKYNRARDDLAAAKRKLTAASRAAHREQTTYEGLRQQIAEMAAAAYKSGDMSSVTTLLSASDPQSVLDQISVFTHVSETRAFQLTEFLASAQRLRREQAVAKQAYDDVAQQAAGLRRQKQQIERAIAKQKALLRQAGVSSSAPRTGGSYTGPASGPARQALDFAYAQLGKPYCYGGAGPSCYDCSGLTMRAWGAAGVSLPHNAAAQFSAIPSSRHVSFDNLQPGDLVFFNSLGHEGMYVGNGKMIHSPHTGSYVSIVSITSGYYRSNFYGAARP